MYNDIQPHIVDDLQDIVRTEESRVVSSVVE
jgi:hypothetical protein